MKKIVLVVVFAIFGIQTNAQEQLNKNKKVEIEVNGNCDMCKKRIEKAAFSVKGVKIKSTIQPKLKTRLIPPIVIQDFSFTKRVGLLDTDSLK